MTDPSYSLHLYSSVKAEVAKSYKGDITRVADDWRRSWRLQGGCWAGSFSIVDQPYSYCQQFCHEAPFGHFVEKTGSDITWEGRITGIDFNRDHIAPRVDVDVTGYVFTLNDRIVEAGDDTSVNASTRISTIANSDADADTDFIVAGRIASNTLQVYNDTGLDQYAWDEIMKITSLGDADAMPWQAWVDIGQRFNYNKVENSPLYKVMGGIKIRWAADQFYNSVRGAYTNNRGRAITMTEATDSTSIGRYGKRVFYLGLDRVTAAAAAAKQNMVLKENAYPRWVTVGASGELEIQSLSGETMAFSPWRLRPGVYLDAESTDVTGTTVGSTDWLKDPRHFLVDEVEVSADERVSLRTAYFTEADLLEAQEDYYREFGGKMKHGKKKKKKKGLREE